MDDLWRFALSSWRIPGVEESCLQLQDKHGFQVALLLAGAWLACRGTVPDAAMVKAMQDRLAPWKVRLQSLRGLRREASTQAAWQEWKRLLADAELEAERLALSDLEQLLQAYPRAGENAQPVLEWFLLINGEAQPATERLAALSQLASLLTDKWCPPA